MKASTPMVLFRGPVFWGGMDSEAWARELHRVLDHMIAGASFLQQPPHSSSEREAEAVRLVNAKARAELRRHYRSLGVALGMSPSQSSERVARTHAGDKQMAKKKGKAAKAAPKKGKGKKPAAKKGPAKKAKPARSSARNRKSDEEE